MEPYPPNKLSSSNIKKVLPYIFLDTKDNIHSLWLEDSNNNYILNIVDLVLQVKTNLHGIK